eukprot:CAMPEP_0117495982 /NCGR_PEP_ID=MMETSP0784-20121206/20417_1 /TAXON_ID=39447 /ORGANISM="" /LENGTH=63 /DNA_ID=CAMNT_0005290929 /DNA_START=78 /DNA_END=266 /DNA_ORIENTATION=-
MPQVPTGPAEQRAAVGSEQPWRRVPASNARQENMAVLTNSIATTGHAFLTRRTQHEQDLSQNG